MNTTRLIEAYLDGSLDKETTEEIRTRSENDVEFAELIRLHKEINVSINDNELDSLRRTLRRISTESNFTNSRTMFPRERIIQIAAVFIFIIIISTSVSKWFSPGYSESRIFGKFYSKYEPDIVTRSGNLSKSNLEKAQFLYQTEANDQCATLLKNIVANDKQNYLAWFYLGLVKIELQQPDESVNAFLKIPPDWNSPYAIHRNWYLALCLIKTGHVNQAQPLLKLLLTGDQFYSVQARKILNRIRI